VTAPSPEPCPQRGTQRSEEAAGVFGLARDFMSAERSGAPPGCWRALRAAGWLLPWVRRRRTALVGCCCRCCCRASATASCTPRGRRPAARAARTAAGWWKRVVARPEGAVRTVAKREAGPPPRKRKNGRPGEKALGVRAAPWWGATRRRPKRLPKAEEEAGFRMWKPPRQRGGVSPCPGGVDC
jgi:hypothetical protein